MNKLKSFINKIRYWFAKWKLVDSNIYYIIPKDEWIFRLSTLEQSRAQSIINKSGDVNFLFCPTAIGNGVYVIVHKTNEKIDITDYSSW